MKRISARRHVTQKEAKIHSASNLSRFSFLQARLEAEMKKQQEIEAEIMRQKEFEYEREEARKRELEKKELARK
jgi:hypothetical protein